MHVEKNTEGVLKTLAALALFEVNRDPVRVEQIAQHRATTESEVRLEIDALDAFGLARFGNGWIERPVVTRAGTQFMARAGRVDEATLRFLPDFIDDLNARRAMLDAGTSLVSNFGASLHLPSVGIRFARDLIPERFAADVNLELAVGFFAALNAVIARMVAQVPAACVAEELMAIAMLIEAQGLLELELGVGELSAVECEVASAALFGIFELFGDEDSLDMFAVVEPSAALDALPDSILIQLANAEERPVEWFTAFGHGTATGHVKQC